MKKKTERENFKNSLIPLLRNLASQKFAGLKGRLETQKKDDVSAGSENTGNIMLQFDLKTL